MTFPMVGTPGFSEETVAATSHDIILPTSYGINDILLMVLAVDGSPTLTIPTGWNELWNVLGTLSTFRCYGGWRRVTGDSSEATDLTWESTASEGSTTVVWPISGSHTTTAPEAATAFGDSVNPDPPVLDPTGWAVEDTLWFLAFGVDTSTDVSVSTAPTNYDDLSNHGTGTVNDCMIAKAIRNLAASSEDPGTAALSATEQWIAATVAFRPAVPSPPSLQFDRPVQAPVNW